MYYSCITAAVLVLFFAAYRTMFSTSMYVLRSPLVSRFYYSVVASADCLAPSRHISIEVSVAAEPRRVAFSRCFGRDMVHPASHTWRLHKYQYLHAYFLGVWRLALDLTQAVINDAESGARWMVGLVEAGHHTLVVPTAVALLRKVGVSVVSACVMLQTDPVDESYRGTLAAHEYRRCASHRTQPSALIEIVECRGRCHVMFTFEGGARCPGTQNWRGVLVLSKPRGTFT